MTVTAWQEHDYWAARDRARMAFDRAHPQASIGLDEASYRANEVSSSPTGLTAGAEPGRSATSPPDAQAAAMAAVSGGTPPHRVCLGAFNIDRPRPHVIEDVRGRGQRRTS